MRVYDPTTTSLSVSWEHAEGPVVQYRITYAQTTGDPIEEYVSILPINFLHFILLEGKLNNVVLQNLDPDTPYNIKVTAIYADGPGGELEGDGRTVGMLGPRNLRVSDEWYTRFRVSWDPAPSRVNGYKLIYQPEGAKADLVFLIDGSWSIGDDSFNKVIQFTTKMTAAFDVISPEGMQVKPFTYLKHMSTLHYLMIYFLLSAFYCQPNPSIFTVFKQVSFVQYSDDAKTEFKLNTYHDKGIVISALQSVRYRGGNTKTGVALKHVYEKVLTSDSGMRKNVPKVLVVVTDGQSQDEVKKSAEKLQHSGYSVFVVGVSDIDMRELTAIGSKPSERHVFVLNDYDAFDKIQDNLITFICETATSSFRMLEAFNITDRTFAGMNGVSMEPGSFNSYIAYRLHKDSYLTQPTK
ncbi:hypothetical protein GOODEAATRI_000581 [Goodea atripinnis]|uniref:Collagen alpha-1(XII) chain n=1 Tax=Goodea atripinnis TaxID=208336 RepID=A0ABV0MZ29_9TELE